MSSFRGVLTSGLAGRSSRLAVAAVSPGGLQAIVRRRPFSVSAFRLIQGLRASGLGFRSVVDVGANIGQFSAAALGTWPEATVLAFEPLPDSARRLRLNLGHHPNFHVEEMAIGAIDGVSKFYPHRFSLSSSILQTLNSVRSEAWAEELEPIEVSIHRLDTVVALRTFARPTLLKLDVQGLEIGVLEGAPNLLERVDAILLEVAFEQSYQNQPLFQEVNRWLCDRSWERVRPLDWRVQNRHIIEADLLYTRA